MSLWSKIKKVAKKVWRAAKSVVRQVVRVVIEAINRLTFGLPDLLLGFIAWPPKKLRIHIFILRDENGNEVASLADLGPSITYATQTFKDRANVTLKPYGASMVEIVKDSAPTAALEVSCDTDAWQEEFGEAGDFFAKHLAGWNVIPISPAFPVTVFIVRDVKGKYGCSLGPLSDYVTVDIDGVKSQTTLAHEVAHACGLWHSKTQSNLLWPNSNRGNGLKWWQKNIFRSARHVQYW